MTSYSGAAVIHEGTAYFSEGYDVYIPEDKWSKLKPCSSGFFSMAVANHKLTTIGGRRGFTPTNTLFCLIGSAADMKWEEFLPRMPTERVRPAAVTTSTHLVVVGGKKALLGTPLSTVEVLNLNTLQWASADSSPGLLGHPTMTLCGEHVYMSGDNTIFSCSVRELIKSESPVWNRLPSTLTSHTTLATLRGHILTIGGINDNENRDTPAGAICCYDDSTNSWSVIGEMPTPRYCTLVAVLPSNELVVVGGYEKKQGISIPCSITDIAY